MASTMHAETVKVGSYMWTYRINGDTAEIYGTYNSSSYSYMPAISPEPTGAVTMQGDCPTVGYSAFSFGSSSCVVRLPQGD